MPVGTDSTAVSTPPRAPGRFAARGRLEETIESAKRTQQSHPYETNGRLISAILLPWSCKFQQFSAQTQARLAKTPRFDNAPALQTGSFVEQKRRFG